MGTDPWVTLEGTGRGAMEGWWSEASKAEGLGGAEGNDKGDLGGLDLGVPR